MCDNLLVFDDFAFMIIATLISNFELNVLQTHLQMQAKTYRDVHE